MSQTRPSQRPHVSDRASPSVSPEVVVVGSVNVDTVIRVPRLPAPGETVLGIGAAEHVGGKGSNQAVAAARLGRRVGLVGAVGDDADGRAVREALGAEGIDLVGSANDRVPGPAPPSSSGRLRRELHHGARRRQR